MSGPNGSHDDLGADQGYDDPWPVLVARCALLDSVDLAEYVARLLDRDRDQLTEPMREALQFQVIRLNLLADAMSAALHAGAGDQR